MRKRWNVNNLSAATGRWTPVPQPGTGSEARAGQQWADDADGLALSRYRGRMNAGAASVAENPGAQCWVGHSSPSLSSGFDSRRCHLFFAVSRVTVLWWAKEGRVTRERAVTARRRSWCLYFLPSVIRSSAGTISSRFSLSMVIPAASRQRVFFGGRDGKYLRFLCLVARKPKSAGRPVRASWRPETGDFDMRLS